MKPVRADTSPHVFRLEGELRHELRRANVLAPRNARIAAIQRARNLTVPCVGDRPGEMDARILARALEALGVPDPEGDGE